MKEGEIAEALSLPKAKTRESLQRLVEEGVIEKRKRPAGYVVKPMELFD
jgi:DNA processing protein